MPTYSYACDGCGREFEKEQRISEPAIKKCPSCGKQKARRMITSGNFILKGGGWYSDGYGSSKSAKSKEASPSSKDSASTSKDSTASSSSRDSSSSSSSKDSTSSSSSKDSSSSSSKDSTAPSPSKDSKPAPSTSS